MSIDIVVRRRQDDYQAFLADNEGVWERGSTRTEAVGKLVFSAREIIGVSIVEEKREEAPRPEKQKRLSKKALDKAVLKFVNEGSKIDGIKLVRANRTIGLREALNYVDKLTGSRRRS